MAMQAEKQIGEFRISASKLPAMRAVKLSARLGRVIGPAVAAAFRGGAFANVKSVAELDIAALNLEAVVAALFANLTPDELEVVLRELLSSTLCNGQPVMETFDVLFADHLELVIPLVKFVIAHQFGSFGRALLAAGGAAMKAAPLNPESDSTSMKS